MNETIIRIPFSEDVALYLGLVEILDMIPPDSVQHETLIRLLDRFDESDPKFRVLRK